MTTPINNVKTQEILDKIINDLNLVRTHDIIPHEYSTKILMSYNVNPDNSFKIIRDASTGDASKTFTVPADKRWKLLAVHNRITTTATIGTRRFMITIDDQNGNEIWRGLASGAGQAASTTQSFNCQPATSLLGLTNQEAIGSFPSECQLKQNWTITISDQTDVDATDTLLTSVWYLEMPDTRE